MWLECWVAMPTSVMARHQVHQGAAAKWDRIGYEREQRFWLLALSLWPTANCQRQCCSSAAEVPNLRLNQVRQIRYGQKTKLRYDGKSMTQTTHALKPTIVRALRQSKIEQDTVSFQAPADRALEQTVLDVLRVLGGQPAGPHTMRFPSDPKPILKRVIAAKAIVRGEPDAINNTPTPAPSITSEAKTVTAPTNKPAQAETAAKPTAVASPKPTPITPAAPKPAKPTTAKPIAASEPAASPAKPKREPSSLKAKSRRELQIMDGRGAVVAVMDVSDLTDVETRKLASRLRLPSREPVGLLLVETTTREFKL